MSKIADATARPWQVGLHIGLPVILDANGNKVADIIFERGVAAVLSDPEYRQQLAANARLIVQAVNSFEAMRDALRGLLHRHCDGSEEQYWAEWDTASEALKLAGEHNAD